MTERALETGDPQDFSIPIDTDMLFIYAGRESVSSFGYHFLNRGWFTLCVKGDGSIAGRCTAGAELGFQNSLFTLVTVLLLWLLN